MTNSVTYKPGITQDSKEVSLVRGNRVVNEPVKPVHSEYVTRKPGLIQSLVAAFIKKLQKAGIFKDASELAPNVKPGFLKALAEDTVELAQSAKKIKV